MIFDVSRKQVEHEVNGNVVKTVVAASLECALQPGKVLRAGISKNVSSSPF